MILDPRNGIFHSHTNTFYRGNDLTLELAVTNIYRGGCAFTLEYTSVNGTKKLEMNVGEKKLGAQIYYATISKNELSDISILDYSISDGAFTLFDYEVLVTDAPVYPSVIITELYPRPQKGSLTTRYVELTNISDTSADLYDYKLSIIASGKERSVFITDTAGELYISPSETLILRFLVKESFDENGNIKDSKETYLNKIYDENPYVRLETKAARVVDINITRISPKTGLIETDPTLFSLGASFDPTTIRLSSREGDKSENDFEINLNRSYTELDILNSRAIITSVDPSAPSVGRVVMRNADATPGILDPITPIPDPSNASIPAILLTSPVTPHIMSEGELRIAYSIIGDTAFSYAEIYSDGYSERRLPVKISDNDYELIIEKQTVIKNKKLRLAIFADNGNLISSLGDSDRPLEILITDNVGPSVSMISPKPHFCYSGDYLPEISGTVHDVSGVNISSCRIFIDDTEITDDVEWEGCKFTYTPKNELTDGEHKIRFKLFDLLGNISKLSSPFMIAPESEMNCYFGEVHNHTSESDGMGTPAESIIYARDVVGMDYYAVTEHSHYMVDNKYPKQIELSNSFNEPGKFASLYGWEMTWTNASGWWGHLNVIGSDSVIVDKDSYSLGMLCDWLDKNGGIGMYNHPGYTWGNFNEFAMPASDSNKNICLAEIKGSAYDREYAHMLKKGYHTAPLYNDDAHSKTWGNNNKFTGYVLAPYLSRENVLDAFRKRRTYSTSDRTLKLKYSINGKWLGSTLENPDKLNVAIDISTESEAGIGKIQLLTANSIVVKEINVGVRQNYSWHFTIDPLYPFYYVRLVGVDKYSVTAPVWISGNDELKIKELKLDSSANEQKPITLNFVLDNTSDETLTSVKTDVYITPNSGVTMGDEPYLTVYTDKIKPGCVAKLSRTIPSVQSNRLVTIVTTAKKKNKTIAACDSVSASQILIAEIMPLTSAITVNTEAEEITVENPYAYVKLYNNSCRDVLLEKASVRLWRVTGKAPNENNIADVSGSTIKSRSTLVVWQRKAGSPLTVADFNTHYGTALVEGEDIITTDKTIVSTSSIGALTDLLVGNDILSRASYNYCREEMTNEIEENKPFHYFYSPNFTAATKRLTNKHTPRPDCVYEDQKNPFVSGDPTSKELKTEKKVQKKAEKESTHRSGSDVGKNLSIFGGVTAAGAIIGGALAKPKKVVVKTESSTDPKVQKKAQKKAEKRVAKKITKEISKQLGREVDKKISQIPAKSIDIRMQQDKQTIKQAKKNIKTLKMRKKAEKASQKREKELKKLRGY